MLRNTLIELAKRFELSQTKEDLLVASILYCVAAAMLSSEDLQELADIISAFARTKVENKDSDKLN